MRPVELLSDPISTAGDNPKMAPSWALVFTASFAVVISVVGFLGNLLTILALPHAKKLRTAATWFVVNLAVIEMCFCVTVLPMSAAHLMHLQATGQRLFNSSGCRVFVFLRYVIIQAEVLSIAAIAINRCVLIAVPKKYGSIFSSRKTFAFIIGIWGLSIFAMMFPLTEIYGMFSYNESTQECDFDSSANDARKLFLAVGFLVPCAVIILSYSYIFYKSQESSQRIRNRNAGVLSSESRPSVGLRQREMRIARTIAVIFLAFIVCCTPVSAAHYYGSQGQIPLLLLLLHPLYWLQYCLNGFIYVFMNKQYRDAYVNYISQWWPKFKTISQQCYQASDEDTSVSGAVGKKIDFGKYNAANVFRKISNSQRPSIVSQTSSRTATPTSKKKFQVWDSNPEKKVQNIQKIEEVNKKLQYKNESEDLGEHDEVFQKVSASERPNFKSSVKVTFSTSSEASSSGVEPTNSRRHRRP